MGSLRPPLSLLPKQDRSSLLTHCPEHPPSAPGGSYSVAERRVGTCSSASLRSVSVPVLGFLL